MTLTVHITVYVGTQSYTMRVAITNYSQVAIVFSEKIFRNTVYFKTTLYGKSFLHPLLGEKIIFPKTPVPCPENPQEGGHRASIAKGSKISF